MQPTSEAAGRQSGPPRSALPCIINKHNMWHKRYYIKYPATHATIRNNTSDQHRIKEKRLLLPTVVVTSINTIITTPTPYYKIVTAAVKQ